MKTITTRTNDKKFTMVAGIQRKNKGLVIIAVLWMVVVLMVMTAILGRTSRLDMKVCLARMEAVRCKWACRAGIEKESEGLYGDDQRMDHHPPSFSLLLSVAEGNELVGDYRSCLENLKTASRHRHNYYTQNTSSPTLNSTQNSYPRPRYESNRGASYDQAHHAAGHAHHHGH